jgi:DNA-binding YbaB/EbfC family protein
MNQAAMMKLRKMQKEMMEAQKRIAETVFTGTAGGVVSVKMTGEHKVVEVKIDKDAFESKDDIDMIEDSLTAAFNDCISQIEKKTEEDLGVFSQGLPGGFF